MTWRLIILGLVLAALAGLGVSAARFSSPSDGRPAPELADPQLFNPTANGLVASPLVVRGEAPGTWFFEASLPVRLETETGEILAQAAGQAERDSSGEVTWMTVNPVPFSTTLVFAVPLGVERGYLVVAKDNPSGLPENAQEIRVPVRFTRL